MIICVMHRVFYKQKMNRQIAFESLRGILQRHGRDMVSPHATDSPDDRTLTVNFEASPGVNIKGYVNDSGHALRRD